MSVGSHKRSAALRQDGPAAGNLQGNTVSKNNNTQTASPIRAEFDLGTDALKLGFEKTSKLYERVRDFNSGNI
jgi:hypothetical protein